MAYRGNKSKIRPVDYINFKSFKDWKGKRLKDFQKTEKAIYGMAENTWNVDKRLICKTSKELLQVNSKTNNLI